MENHRLLRYRTVANWGWHVVTDERRDEAEFVNRVDELAFMSALLPPNSTTSSLVILRAPTGYGKSRLTDELIRRLDPATLAIVVVDPLIRHKPDGRRIYDGFFVQFTARSVDAAARSTTLACPPLQAFLESDRVRNVRSKRIAGDLQKLPSMGTLYGIAIEYGERWLAKGRFSAAHHLASDSKESIAICREYLTAVARAAPLLLVVREAHQIDHESLRTLVQMNVEVANNHLIVEYTDGRHQFDPDHQKVLLRELSSRANAHLIDLVRLERGHLEQLLRHTSQRAIELRTESYVKWDGNLRLIEEVQYRVGIGRTLETDSDIVKAVVDVRSSIKDRIEELPALQRWILAIVAAHVEGIQRRLLVRAALMDSPHVTEAALARDLHDLERRHGYVRTRADVVSLAHEDLADTIRTTKSIAGLLARAEARLCDAYVDIIESRDFSLVAAVEAARRAITLCARTRDSLRFLHLLEGMHEQIQEANDQTVYCDLAIDAIKSIGGFLPEERARLVEWAMTLAYVVNDFHSTQTLLEPLPVRSPMQTALLAFSLLEHGGHDQAVALATELRQIAKEDWVMCADLIDAGADLDRGMWRACREKLERIVERGKDGQSPIVGHALRLLSEVDGEPDGTEHAIASVRWYDRIGLVRCRAYSALSAATFLARRGDFGTALQWVDEAQALLGGSLRNEHIILNNRAFVMMLSPKPDFAGCTSLLRRALRTSRNDFADLSILSNLAIALWKSDQLSAALDCVRRAEVILDDPEFAERDIFWTACFSLANVLEAAGDALAATAMKARPKAAGWADRSFDRYWAVKYGEGYAGKTELPFMIDLDYHPCAISHWQLDFEALEVLTAGSRG